MYKYKLRLTLLVWGVQSCGRRKKLMDAFGVFVLRLELIFGQVPNEVFLSNPVLGDRRSHVPPLSLNVVGMSASDGVNKFQRVVDSEVFEASLVEFLILLVGPIGSYL